MRGVLAGLAAIALAGAVAPAAAQPIDAPDFGPQIAIEAVEVRGNTVTAARIIRRALGVGPGDVLRAGDPRLTSARGKVLALGFFRAVELAMRRGSERGRVVLVVTVEERGTIVLNRIWLGQSGATPLWAGLDLDDRNFLGTGVEVGGGGLYAVDSEVAGGTAQWAAQLRAGVASMAGTRFGVHGQATAVDASEPVRVAGAFSDGDPDNFEAFSYERVGGKLGVGFDATALSRLSLDARVERVDADIPMALAVGDALAAGTSWVNTLAVGFDRDTRPDPILPFTGDRITVIGEAGGGWLGADYDFASVLARYERWFPLRAAQHVVSVHVTGGAVFGDAPVFDRFYVGDLNRLMTPRAHGLVLSTRPPFDLLATGADEFSYGDLAALAELQYAYRLFRRRGPIYGGDLWVGAGVLGLADRDADVGAADLGFDVGVRLDTEIGIFELTIGNGLGRLPL